jgi:hypothetical protein
MCNKYEEMTLEDVRWVHIFIPGHESNTYADCDMWDDPWTEASDQITIYYKTLTGEKVSRHYSNVSFCYEIRKNA